MKYWCFCLLLLSCGREVNHVHLEDEQQYLDFQSFEGRCATTYSRLHSRSQEEFNIGSDRASEQIKITHLNELMLLPASVRNFLKLKNVKVNLSSGSVTSFSKFKHLKNQTPRGWEGSGYTWDSVPGAGDKFGVYLGNPSLPNKSGSLALHEMGHTIDFNGNLSGDRSWKKAYLYWRNLPHWQDEISKYRFSHIEEFIATAIDDYYCSSQSRRRLEAWYSGLGSLVKDSMARLEASSRSDHVFESFSHSISADH